MTYIQEFMEDALKEAEHASDCGEIPVGALIVKDGKIIAKASNMVEGKQNPLMHAEMICIDEALKVLNGKWLKNCEMYVTLEPCPMCMGAIMNARIKRLYIGAPDMQYGACGSKYNLSETLNHKCEVYFGILEEKSKKMINDFFKKMRNKEE